MNNISFTSKAWEEYCYWQMQDKKTLKRINNEQIEVVQCKGHYDE